MKNQLAGPDLVNIIANALDVTPKSKRRYSGINRNQKVNPKLFNKTNNNNILVASG